MNLNKLTPDNDITTLILNAFESGDFETAFTQIFTFPHHHVNSILSERKWLTEPKIADYFWNIYCIKEHLLVFGGKSSETILNWYLINPKQTSDELNELLVQRHSEKFIQSIKRNRSFLNKPFLSRLDEYPWKNEDSNELVIWNKIQRKHQTLQKEIDFAWQKIKNKSIDSLLNSITYWNEMSLHIAKVNLDREEMVREFNYIIDYISSKITLDEIDIPVKQFEGNYYSDVSKSNHNAVDEFKNSIKMWIQFESTLLNSYCFDDTFKPNFNGDNLDFIFSSKKTNSKWNRIKDRYTVNSLRYFEDAIDIYDQQKDSLELNIPLHFQKHTAALIEHLHIRKLQSSLFLEDLQIYDITLSKRAIHLSKLVGGLMHHHIYHDYRSAEANVASMVERQSFVFRMRSITKIKEQFQLSKHQISSYYVYRPLPELISYYRKIMPELEEDEITKLIDIFSYTLRPAGSFDPLHIKFNVLETPFLRIGNSIFTSTSLFSIHEWFYGFAQQTLRFDEKNSDKNKKEASFTNLKLTLGKFFAFKNWKVMTFDFNENKAARNPIDLLISDGNSQLFIQLHRSEFKLNSEIEHTHCFDPELTAAGEMNEAIEKMQEQSNSENEVSENHNKWIVSTNFEGLYTEKDVCLKVNYFDLLWTLRNKDFTSLSEFIQYVEMDKPYKDCVHYLQMV